MQLVPITLQSSFILFIRYEKFIDEFGARPSGSDVLERAIDHMINLTIENGVNDVTTEDVMVYKKHDYFIYNTTNR